MEKNHYTKNYDMRSFIFVSRNVFTTVKLKTSQLVKLDELSIKRYPSMTHKISCPFFSPRHLASCHRVRPCSRKCNQFISHSYISSIWDLISSLISLIITDPCGSCDFFTESKLGKPKNPMCLYFGAGEAKVKT